MLQRCGFGEKHLKWNRLLYTDSSSMLKIGSGLSCPFSCTKRGKTRLLYLSPTLKFSCRTTSAAGFYKPGHLICLSSAKLGEEEHRQLLALVTPQLRVFETVGRKALYITCVKVSYLQQLFGLACTKWSDLFGMVDALKETFQCLQCLYKPSLDKQAADLH